MPLLKGDTIMDVVKTDAGYISGQSWVNQRKKCMYIEEYVCCSSCKRFAVEATTTG